VNRDERFLSVQKRPKKCAKPFGVTLILYDLVSHHVINSYFKASGW